MVVGFSQTVHRRGTGSTLHCSVSVPSTPLRGLSATERACTKSGAVVALETLQSAHGWCTDDGPVLWDHHTIHPVKRSFCASIGAGAHLPLKGVGSLENPTPPGFIESCLGQWIHLRHYTVVVIPTPRGTGPIGQTQGVQGHGVIVLTVPVVLVVERPWSGGGAVIRAIQWTFGAIAIADTGYSSIGPKIHC